MATKFVTDAMYNAYFDTMMSSCGLMLSVCSGSEAPTTRTEADSGSMLAKVSASYAEFTVAAGSAGGRKVTVAAHNGISVTNSGSGNYICVYGSASLFLTTQVPAPQALVGGNTVNVAAFTDEIGTPV